MANKLELVSLGGIPHCYNRNVSRVLHNSILAKRDDDSTTGELAGLTNQILTDHVFSLITYSYYSCVFLCDRDRYKVEHLILNGRSIELESISTLHVSNVKKLWHNIDLIRNIVCVFISH